MHFFLHCRPGFEKECAAEITERTAELGQYGYIKIQESSAYVLFVTHEPEGARHLVQNLPFHELIFVRQWFEAAPIVTHLTTEDRVKHLLDVTVTFLADHVLMVDMHV